jgi:hypothetical protein
MFSRHCLRSLAIGLGLGACAPAALAQLSVDWFDTYGFEAPRPDGGRDVAVDAQGNVYVTGESAVDIQEHDYVTIKYDAAGTRQWVRRYNGIGDKNDEGRAIGLDAAGNVYVAGISWGGGNFGTPPKYDVVTIKYDPAGNEQWVHRFNSAYDNDDFLSGMHVMPDGSVYIGGYSYGPIGQPADADYTLYRLDPNGQLAWSRFYDGPEDEIDWLSATLSADATGVYFGASVEVWTGADDMSIYGAIKYDPDGNVVWESSWQPPVVPFGFPDFNIVFDSTVDASGNFIVVGRADDGTTSDSPADARVVKFDAAGNVAWSASNRTLLSDEFERVTTDAQGNVYAVGAFNVEMGSLLHAEHLTAAYDADGNLLWEHRFGGDGPWFDGEGYAEINSRGELVVATRNIMDATGEDMRVFLYDRADGAILDTAAFDFGCCDWIQGLALDAQDNVIMTGHTRPDGTNRELAVVKMTIGAGSTPGDVNGDGIVNFADVLAVIGAWGPCAGACPADLDGSGDVAFADILVVLANWT